MQNKECLATQLSTYMERARTGDARLASHVNSMMANPYFIHRSTLRNWRDGSSQKVNNWRQLVMVAAALNLSKDEANDLLTSASCPPISALANTTRECDRRLLVYWNR